MKSKALICATVALLAVGFALVAQTTPTILLPINGGMMFEGYALSTNEPALMTLKRDDITILVATNDYDTNAIQFYTLPLQFPDSGIYSMTVSNSTGERTTNLANVIIPVGLGEESPAFRTQMQQ